MLKHQILDPCRDSHRSETDQLDTAAASQVNALPIPNRAGQSTQGILIDQVRDRCHRAPFPPVVLSQPDLCRPQRKL